MIAASSLSLMMSSCDWGILGSSPDSVVVRPPMIDPIVNPIVNPIVKAIEPEQTTPPTAKLLDSRPGFVFNPYTGNIVDVRGLASGLLVRDPEDPDKAHTFYVP